MINPSLQSSKYIFGKKCRSMRKNEQVTINTAGLFVTLIGQWIILFFHPRIGDLEETGVLSLASGIANMLLSYANYNIRTYMVSDNFKRHKVDEYISARKFTIISGTIICGLICIGGHYNGRELVCILLFWSYRCLSSFIDLYSGFWQISGKVEYIGWINIVDGIVCVVFFEGFYFFSKNLIYALVGMILGVVLIEIPLVFYIQKSIINFQVSCHEKIQCGFALLWECAPLMLVGVLPTILNAVPRMILKEIVGDYYLGIYGTISAPAVFIPTLVAGVLTPYIGPMAKKYEKGSFKEMMKIAIKIGMFISAVCVVIILFSKIMGYQIFSLLVGEEIAIYHGIFEILVLGMLFSSLNTILSSIMTIMDFKKQILIIGLFSMIMGIVFVEIGAVYATLWGVAFANVMTYALQFIIMLIYINLKKRGRKNV